MLAYMTLQGSINPSNGMDVLRKHFPNCEVDENNFVLFSMDTLHGGPVTIEQIEADLNQPITAFRDPIDRFSILTYLIIQPRIVLTTYGLCEPKTQEDIDWLKALRQNSKTIIANIG